MPEVLRFRSTWGISPGTSFGNFKKWFPELKAQGYAGVEVNIEDIENSGESLSEFKLVCEEIGLKVNALCFSAWPNYEGPRPAGLGVKQQLVAYQKSIMRAKLLDPFKINCQSGADYFTLDEAVQFYKETLAIDAELGVAGRVCHETHRNRALYNPYSTHYIIKHVPELRITTDVSHHVVCCERLLDVNEEDKILYQEIVAHVHHIHARIGTTQSSQCPDPTNDIFKAERDFFEKHWKQSIEAHVKVHGPEVPITFVPEYGPYPYHAFNAARSFSEVADTEGTRLQVLFEQFAQNAIK